MLLTRQGEVVRTESGPNSQPQEEGVSGDHVLGVC